MICVSATILRYFKNYFHLNGSCTLMRKLVLYMHWSCNVHVNIEEHLSSSDHQFCAWKNLICRKYSEHHLPYKAGELLSIVIVPAFCSNLDSIFSLVSIATSDAEFIKSQTMEDKSEELALNDEQVKIEIIAATTKQCEVNETVSTSIFK